MSKYRNYFFNDSIVAPSRINRPMVGKQNEACPFCKENEKELEVIYDEVWEGEKLLVRILANKYPVIPIQGDYAGLHDVIIDTANHWEHPKDFSPEHWQVLLLMMQKRWQQLSKNEKIVFIQIFKNHGSLAGASIYHSHWQLVAMTKIPYGMISQYEKYQKQKESPCFLCERNHLKEAILIKETSLWRLIIPPNPEFNYEIWLVPKSHRQHFGELVQKEVVELGNLLKQLLMVYDILLPEGAFNICMMSGDLRGEWQYHFHIKLMMRIGHIAGFEIATHCHILMIDREQYALRIKQLLQG